MRYWYVNKQREKVFQTRSLVIMTMVAAIVLVAIQPRDSAFRDMLGGMRADAVALNYARVLVALQPDDLELRALLAQQYVNLGRLAEADAVLISLSKHPDISPQERLLHLSVLQKRLYATNHAESRLRLQARVVALLNLLDVNALDYSDREKVAKVALAFEQPKVAAHIYITMFIASRDPHWALEAGRNLEAAGLPHLAANAYGRAASVPGAHVQRSIHEAFRLYLAGGGVDDGVAFLSRLAPEQMSPALQLEAVQFALAANAPDLAARYSALIAESDANQQLALTAEHLKRLTIAALSVQDLHTARIWAQRALNQNPENPELRKQIAQITEWQGDVEAALPHWRWLAHHDPPNAEMPRTWHLAKALHREDVVADVLSQLSTQQPLNAPELNAWLGALSADRAVDRTIAALRRYVARFPEEEAAWRAGVRLLEQNEQYADALAWISDLEHRFTLTNDDLRLAAELHWRLYDHKAALAMLNRIEGDVDDPGYWRDRAHLAARLEQPALANASLLRLAELDALNPREYDILLSTMSPRDHALYRQFAALAWQDTGLPRFLLMSMAAELPHDPAHFERLLQQARAHHDALAGKPLYWTLRGRHEARHGNIEQARTLLARALRLSSDYAPAVAAYAWLLIDSRELTALWQLLDERPGLALQHPELAAPFAAGYMALARHEEAAFWYRKAIETEPHNLYLALGLSTALDKTGRVDEARHWRRSTFADALGRTEGLGSEDVSVLRALTAPNLGRPDFEALVHDANRDHLPAVVRTLVNDQLAAQHYDAARYWLRFADANDIQIDGYARFMVAHQGRDIDAMAPFKHDHRPTLRAEALLASREDSAALLTALAQINTLTPESERLMLTRMAADISIDRPSGVRSEATLSNFGTLATQAYTIDVARSFDALTASVTLSDSVSQLDAELVADPADEQISERSATLRLGGGGRNSRWEAEAGIVRSDAGDRLPVAVTATRQWDQMHSSYARLAIDQAADDSPLLKTFGRKDQLEVGHTWQPTARDTATIQLAHQQFADRGGTMLSKGTRMQAGWQHAVFFERPAVIARAALSSARREALTLSAPLAGRIAEQAYDDLLPERVDRIGFGLTVAHGEPGRMNWQAPSPRYRFDVDVGYQWPENAPTLELSASVGIRVLGDDELALRLSYASRPDLGSEASGFSAALTYNYRLGR